MRNALTLCLFLVYTISVSAQTGSGLSGSVIDTTGKPVAAATVSLFKATDSLAVKATVTGNDGRFIFQTVTAGSYKINISALGYLRQQSKLINMSNTQPIDIGKITLQTSAATQLKEVTISSTRPFIEHKIDRTVINVDALATNQGISAADVLEKSPGILIDPVNGAISLEGKSGAVVYIDDKKSYLTGNDLVAYLQSLPSGSLQAIELMTNPPAKYDAAGGAVINIRLKKNVVKGFNAGYTQLYGHSHYGKVEERFNFDYRTGKFNLAGNFDDNQNNWAN